VFGFYLYQIVYFLNPASRWWFSGLPEISYSFFVVVLMLTFFMIKFKSHQNNLIKEMPEAKWLICILITYYFVSIFAISREIHFKYLYELTKLYIIFFVAYKMLDSNHKIKMALICYIIGAAYIGYEADNVGRDEFGRVEGIGMVDVPGANGVAAALAPTIPLLVYFFWQGKWGLRLLVSVLGLIIVNGLVLINSRGAFLGVIVGFAYLIGVMAFSRTKLPMQRFLVVIVLLFGSIVVLQLTDDTFWSRMSTIQSTSVDIVDESGAKRVNFWLATFDILADHPFGVGIYGYQLLSPMYLDPSYFTGYFSEIKMIAVHSLWFQALAEIGYIGFILFCLLLYSIYQHLKKAKMYLVESEQLKEYYLIKTVEASMLTYLVAGSFINAFRTEIFYWLLLFCISLGAVALHELKVEKDTNNQAIK
jgi:hypothetical protein